MEEGEGGRYGSELLTGGRKVCEPEKVLGKTDARAGKKRRF